MMVPLKKLLPLSRLVLVMHFFECIEGAMNVLDRHQIKGRYIAIDNAAIHKVSEVQKRILKNDCKLPLLSLYSSFLNPIELFWLKLKAGVKRDCLTTDDSLIQGIIESAKYVTTLECFNWMEYHISFFCGCVGYEPMV